MAGAIVIGDPAIEVRLRRNARARRMILRVAHAGAMTTLTLPPHVPLAAAQAFLKDQEQWLRQRMASCPGGVAVRDGSVLPFGDGSLTIRSQAGRGLVHADGELRVGGGASGLPRRVGAFLREAARAECAGATDRYAADLGLRPGRITLRDPRSRWGSCTATGDLMYSWRLILAPSAVLDYVVAHEVAHLAEMNHSECFWKVVARLCPGFQQPRDWLRRNGAGLHAFDFTPDDAA